MLVEKIVSYGNYYNKKKRESIPNDDDDDDIENKTNKTTSYTRRPRLFPVNFPRVNTLVIRHAQ